MKNREEILKRIEEVKAMLTTFINTEDRLLIHLYITELNVLEWVLDNE